MARTATALQSTQAAESGSSRSTLHPWQKRRPLPHSSSHHRERSGDSQEGFALPNEAPPVMSATPRKRWWRIKYGRGMLNDIKRRAPFYWSDWRDAWDYRVVPATVYMYFAK